MKTIKIKTLHLENFKCHRNLWVNLEGMNASIYGDNATGKSSVYDALTWLLFDKDASGNGAKNIEVKPLNVYGEVADHDAITLVEADLLVDGMVTNLRREYKEIWTTKRGSAQATYDGNASEYYVDGVPVKKNAFQSYVADLLDEETFRMLTSVSRFANEISWQDRRAVLFDIAGVPGDLQIMANDDRFAPLEEGMGRLSLDDYKKKLVAEKKKYAGAKSEIPARINECQKVLEDLQGINFDAIREKMDAQNTRKDELRGKLVSFEHSGALDAKRNEIRNAELELKDWEINNDIFRKNQKSGKAEVGIISIKLNSVLEKLESQKRLRISVERHLEEYAKQISDARHEWVHVNAEEFVDRKCPACGQALPEARRKKAAEAFEADKASKLEWIVRKADEYKRLTADAKENLEKIEDEIRNLEKEKVDLEWDKAEAESAVVEVKDMEDYVPIKTEIEQRIHNLRMELADLASDVSGEKAKINSMITDVDIVIKECMNQLAKEGVLKYTEERVEELRDDARKTAESLEKIEQMLYLIEEYNRYKTSYVEDSINGLFRIARFRLFREQANGGVEERCDVVHDGVPYINVNTGMKINLGIDIINTLSKAYGVSVPLFVDNAESVTKLEGCGNQVIRLVVSENDKELRVENEA